MTDPGGKLHIRLDPDGITIASTRPVRAAGLLVGRDIAATARLLPSLFSVCATAQAAACVAAIEQALGLSTDPGVAAKRRRLVAAETLREHLWRILLDWPGWLREPPDTSGMALGLAGYRAWQAALQGGSTPFTPGATDPEGDEPADLAGRRELTDLLTRRVFGMAPTRWLARIATLDDLCAWSQRTDTVAARLARHLIDTGQAGLGRSRVAALPQLRADDLDRCLSGPAPTVDAFVAAPIWECEPRETSTLTRQGDTALARDMGKHFGNGLLPRLVAQLTEVARILTMDGSTVAGASSIPANLPAGVGLAMIQAARGLLVHRVRVDRDSGHIADYRILAPTEWNFHPRGVAVAGLARLMAEAPRADLERLARLYITALDPCVEFELRLPGPI